MKNRPDWHGLCILFAKKKEAMEEKEINQNEESLLNDIEVTAEQEATASTEEDTKQEPSVEEQLAQALERIAELEKDRLYKQAEFDNYRKNQIKEKADLILNGGKKVLESMLPVVDDFERALQHMDDSANVEAVREGVELILKKFLGVLKTHGVEAIDTNDADFNTDFHEAVAQFPAPTEEQKGKVVDCTKKGYMINEKVLRHAQVVVGV